jgi:hypothetical protein
LHKFRQKHEQPVEVVSLIQDAAAKHELQNEKHIEIRSFPHTNHLKPIQKPT